MHRRFSLTRAAALDQLATKIPHTGQAYTDGRNTDYGPETEPTTTVLSPYFRRRLLLEQEVIAAASAMHGPEHARKFIEEVFWRSYFKGYLETHPSIWDNYNQSLTLAQNQLATRSGLRRVFEDAVAGQTGIEGFDDWVCELRETGWLHNHARMWFASIWIFTLRLPWALGANYFLRHLIDGDPASNTLSWRWVAGLHTRGKVYAARTENIRRYTNGRYAPTCLNETPAPLEEQNVSPTVALQPSDPTPADQVTLLLHLDDLNPESLPLGKARVVRIAGLLAHTDGAVAHLRRADEQAMKDALARAASYFGCETATAEQGWANDLPVVTAWAPVGPSAEALPAGCIRIRRQWDDLTWPRSTRGYFHLKTAIPDILRQAAIC